jgi:hypothetical protein
MMMIISRSILFQMKNISDKIFRENRKIFCFPELDFENRAVYEIMWKNTVEPNRRQMTIWRMRISCWITKVTNTHLEYVTFIAFPPQQWLHERASVLRYTYITCLVVLM